jgi:hypothetical protein
MRACVGVARSLQAARIFRRPAPDSSSISQDVRMIFRMRSRAHSPREFGDAFADMG